MFLFICRHVVTRMFKFKMLPLIIFPWKRFQNFYFMCMSDCLHVCATVCLVSMEAWEGQGSPLKLELQMAVSPRVGAGHRTRVFWKSSGLCLQPLSSSSIRQSCCRGWECKPQQEKQTTSTKKTAEGVRPLVSCCQKLVLLWIFLLHKNEWTYKVISQSICDFQLTVPWPILYSSRISNSIFEKSKAVFTRIFTVSLLLFIHYLVL